MKLDARRSHRAPPWFSISFTKPQAGFLCGGVLALLAVSFSLGFFLAGWQAGENPKSVESANRIQAVSKPTAVKTTIVIPPSNEVKDQPNEEEDRQVADEGDKEKEDGAADIRPNFYRALLKDSPSSKKINPIRLSIQSPGTEEKPSVRKLKSDGGGSDPVKSDIATLRKGDGRGANESKSLLPPKQDKTSRGYTIQVIAVRKPARAIRILQRLRRHGFFGSIQRVDLGKKGVWLRLRVGRYTSRSSALKELSLLRAKASVRGGKIVPL